MKSKLLLFVFLCTAFHSPIFAQGGMPAGANTPKTTGAGSDTNPSDAIARVQVQMNNMMLNGVAGQYLTGNVALAGGALLWDPIPITVTCDSKVRYTTTTDPKGNFAIVPILPAGAPRVSSDPKPLATQFVGCVVDASLPGFNSTPLTVSNRNVGDNPNVGTITLTRESGSTDIALSSASAAAPKEAMKSFDKARAEWIEGKPDRAQHDLQRAVQIYPQFAEAWFQLGKIQEAAKSPDAWGSFSKALAADPKFSLPYEHLATLAVLAQKWPELVDITNHELALNPRGTVNVWYYNAAANMQLKNVAAAKASAIKSLEMDPLHTQPNTEQLLAVILASEGDLAGALQHLRNCLTYLPPGPALDLVKQQIAQIEPAVPAAK
jgi:tetratricopeptide (TPR) repeat protein